MKSAKRTIANVDMRPAEARLLAEISVKLSRIEAAINKGIALNAMDGLFSGVFSLMEFIRRAKEAQANTKRKPAPKKAKAAK